MKDWFFRLLAEHLGPIVGRHNLARIGRFITRAGTLDYPNTIAGNGEAMVQRTLLSLPGGDLLVVDCGANQGQWSSSFLSLLDASGRKGNTRLVCFEPSAHTYALLSSAGLKSVNGRAQIDLEKVALSSEVGDALLSVVHDGAGVNSIVAVPDTFIKQEEITRITLDAYVEQRRLGVVDLLKIDAEGHDLEVIRGAAGLLAAGRIKVLQFEYNWRWIYARNFLRDAFDLLGHHGYTLSKITPQGLLNLPNYSVELETYVEGNYLACQPEYLASFRLVK